MSSELPQGWANASLQELTAHPKQDIVDGPFGSNLKADEYVDDGIPIVRLQNIGRSRFIDKNIRYVTVNKAKDLARHSFRSGDIVITKLGDPVGKACVVPDTLPHGVIVADVVRARLDTANVETNYIVHAINSPAVVSQLNLEVKGSTRPRVNLRHIRFLTVPLAPLEEQRRIVAKLEKLTDKIDASKARLERIPAILKRFRQSVLAAACSGHLTADWREANAGSHIQISWAQLANKRLELWEELQASRHVHEAQPPSATRRKNKYKPAFEPSNNIPDDIPDTWQWVSVSQLALLDTGFAFKSSDFANSGIRLLRGENLEPGKLRWNDTFYWPEMKLDEFRHLLVNEGEIILALDRPIISSGLKIARARKADLPCLLVQRMMRFKLADVRMTQWLFFNLNLQNFIHHLSAGLTGSDIPHVTGTGVGEYALMLPPVAEQQEIVRRVESLFTLADQLEARYKKGKAYVDKLTQSILAKAFRGELVPQDPNDEPAEKLLERILAAKKPISPRSNR